MPQCRLKLEMVSSPWADPWWVTLREMKLKTLGAKCSTGGTRAIPGSTRPGAQWRQVRCSFDSWVDTGLGAA